MNAARRKALVDLVGRVEEAMSDLETIKDEEQEAFDNLPESFQDGERGDAMQAAIDAMEEAGQALDEAKSQLEEAQA